MKKALLVLFLSRVACSYFTLPMGGELRTLYDCGNGPGALDTYPSGGGWHTFETPPKHVRPRDEIAPSLEWLYQQDPDHDDEEDE